jgi:hemerythrin superfamily protein
LTSHATVEEEIFYPAVKKARSENTKDLVREAYEEHTQVKALPAALAEVEPGEESYDAKMKVLQEDVEHHVEEEEGDMFPDAKSSSAKMDWRR